MKVKFIEVISDKKLVPAVKANLKSLNEYKKIGLISSIQHAIHLKDVKEYLESKGKKIYLSKGSSNCKYPGQILGCDVSCALKIGKKIDCFLYLGTGKFHPLGILIKTNKPVLLIDPFTKKLQKFGKKEKDDYEKRRIMTISKAKEANTYGILVSTKPGQYNLQKAQKIKERIENKNKKAVIFLFDILDSNEFLNFRGIDAWINTACPRIVEDTFEKPLINLEESENLFK